jgi:hypothetical protein
MIVSLGRRASSRHARAGDLLRPSPKDSRDNPTVPTPPILVWADDGDDTVTSDSLITFETVSAAESWIEAPEVKDGAYLVWDADGRQAQLAVEKWNVRITEWSDPSPEHLRPLLEAYLAHEGVTGHGRQPFSDLVETAARAAREHELSREWPRGLSRLIERRRKRQS